MPTVEAQGSALIVHDGVRLQSRRHNPSSTRGTITRFTADSRRRLIERMARLNVDGVRTVFLTLTFSGVPSPDQAKAAYRRFIERLRRKFPQSSAIWRMEPQERKSPHFHLLLFNFPYMHHKLIARVWRKCTHERRSFVWVKKIEGGKRQCMYYISKYIAKREAPREAPSLDNLAYLHAEGEWTGDPGRMWGVFNGQKLPYAVRRRLDFADPLAIEELWSWMVLATEGKVGDFRHNARCYHDNPYQFIDRLSMVASCVTRDITHEDGSKITMAD